MMAERMLEGRSTQEREKIRVEQEEGKLQEKKKEPAGWAGRGASCAKEKRTLVSGLHPEDSLVKG